MLIAALLHPRHELLALGRGASACSRSIERVRGARGRSGSTAAAAMPKPRPSPWPPSPRNPSPRPALALRPVAAASLGRHGRLRLPAAGRAAWRLAARWPPARSPPAAVRPPGPESPEPARWPPRWRVGAGDPAAGAAAAGRPGPWPRPPMPPRHARAPRCISGGTGWLSAAKISSVGRNRTAAFGTRNDVGPLRNLDGDVRRHPGLQLVGRVRHLDHRAVGDDVLHDDRLQAHLHDRARELLGGVGVHAELDAPGPAGSCPRRTRRCSPCTSSSSGRRR